MKPWPVLLLIVAPALTEAAPAGHDAEQAHVDYMLKCQGCHRPDGSGDDQSAPPLRGVVARFLTVPGGREFLGRVPGVATANLDDARLVRRLIVDDHLAGVLLWRNYAQQGGPCGTTTNMKIAMLALGRLK